MAAIADHPISDLYFDETNSTVSPIFLPTTRGKSPFFLRRNRAKSSSPNLFLVPCWIGFVSKQIDSKFGSGYHVVRHWDWNSSPIFYFVLFNLLSRFPFFILFVCRPIWIRILDNENGSEILNSIFELVPISLVNTLYRRKYRYFSSIE